MGSQRSAYFWCFCNYNLTFDATTGAVTGVGAGSGVAGYQPYLDQAAGLRGPGAGTGTGSIASYMSPYQQAVTDIEKREATKQYESQVVPALAAKAATTGGFGGSRQAIL